MENNICFLNKQPPECVVFQKLDKFIQNKQDYLFDIKEKWGTKRDWKILLYTDYNSSFITSIIDMMIEESILIENHNIERSGKTYMTYKVGKSWKKKLQDIFIDIHPFVIFLEEWGYEVARP